MNANHTKQRGQALILIVFAIVGLIGMTGLAIDGGNAYSDRRHAQNAADTAALAAALSKTKGADRPTWEQAAREIAAQNGYNPTSNADVSVAIYQCDETGHTPDCVLGAGEVPARFVQVVITSTIRTYFAPVVGLRHITNQVQAIALAVPGEPTPWYDGNALVSLMPGCKGVGWNHDPFDFAGNEVTLVNGTGIFVNSTCDPAFVDNGASNTMTVPAGVCVVGGVDGGVSGVNPAPQANCGSQIDLNQYVKPPLDEHSCDNEGKFVGGSWDGQGYVVGPSGGTGVVYPGNFSGAFPPGNYSRWNLKQGIYCLHGGLKLTGGKLTSDWNNNGIYDVSSEGVLFYIEGGDVDMSGGASVDVHAITSSSTPLGPDLVGYLLYLPPENGSSVVLTGGSESQYVGTILAPGSFVTLNGGNTGDSLNLDAQIIAYSMRLTGSGSLNITYTQNHNATTYSNPAISPYK